MSITGNAEFVSVEVLITLEPEKPVGSPAWLGISTNLLVVFRTGWEDDMSQAVTISGMS